MEGVRRVGSAIQIFDAFPEKSSHRGCSANLHGQTWRNRKTLARRRRHR